MQKMDPAINPKEVAAGMLKLKKYMYAWQTTCSLPDPMPIDFCGVLFWQCHLKKGAPSYHHFLTKPPLTSRLSQNLHIQLQTLNFASHLLPRSGS